MRSLTWLLLFSTMLSCGSGKSEKSLEGFPDDFMNFYERFHSDSAFQMAHISFPLPGIPALVMSGEMPQGYTFLEEEWQIHKAVADSSVAFKSLESLTEDIVEEEIGIDESGLSIYRRFSKIGSEWFLIYYMAPNYVNNKNQ